MTRPASAAEPLVAYVESRCTHARVLYLGRADSPAVALLAEKNPRALLVCDADATRRAEAQARSTGRNVSFGSLDDGPASLRESFFDVVLVENLSAEAEPKKTLEKLSRLLQPRGIAVVATPNPDAEEPLVTGSAANTAVDYYALYDATIDVWPEVRMLGQVPFVGYAVVDFSGEGEPSPVLDTSLVPATGEEPDYFIAIAGREKQVLEAYAVIQLPLAQIREGSEQLTQALPQAASAATETLERELTELRARFSKQEKWIEELEGRSAAADERADAAEAELEQINEQRAKLADSAEQHGKQKLELGAERDRLRTERDGLRTEHNNLRTERDSLRTERDSLRTERDSLRTERDGLRAERDTFSVERDSLRAERDSLRTERDSLRGARDAQRAELAQTSKTHERERAELAADQAALRKELEAMTRRAASLDTTLSEKETELAAKRQELQALLADDQAASEQNRLEAQLKERGDRIAQLERELFEGERVGKELLRRVNELSKAPVVPTRLVERLAEAEAELVTLKWALDLSRNGSNKRPALD